MSGQKTNGSLGFAGERRARVVVVLIMLAAIFPPQARAVIFYATGDVTHNTTAPVGRLSGSGWQWVGYWGGFQGAAIGPHHFLTARHVGGAVGDPVIFNGVSYTTTASFEDTVTDLRILEVSGEFPTWAPLYRASDEVGRGLVVFGRGLTRGAEVRDVATNTLRGWQWGTGDGILRWGENSVSSVVAGGSYWGNLLQATFDATGGPEEAHLAVGDSSGPMFINDGNGWKLAGIAAAVDASFNTTKNGAGFNAAIFDGRGLYFGSSGNWRLIGGVAPMPSSFYASRVSERVAWIDSIVPASTPGDSSDVPLLSGVEMVVLIVAFFSAGIFSISRRGGPQTAVR